MAFRKSRAHPEFADLIGTLAQSRIELGNATYQTIAEIINRLTRFRNLTIEQIDEKLDEGSGDAKYANRFASFITSEDETSIMPNSIQLLAGTGITLDYSIANQLTISSSGDGGGGYWIPISNGDAVSPELLFDSNGEVIVGFQPF